LKAQIKAANKILALKKKLAAATTPEKKAAIRARIASAKAVLAKTIRKVIKVSNRVAA
jgi:tRNA A37 threonylcarbamoyladenosine biosynthesis protein TsaE